MTHITNPSIEMRLTATCYWPAELRAIPPSDSGAVELSITHCDDAGRELGRSRYYVHEQQKRLAEIEASALLDTSPVLNTYPAGKLGLAFHGRRWHSYIHAPYGVGTRLNPIVPGRDFAHARGSARWPFGTRLTMTDIPPMLDGHIRRVMYLGCSFGRETSEERIDLFVAEPVRFYGPVRCLVDRPYLGTRAQPISRKPVKGAQQALLMLGYDLGRWRDDGIWGDASQGALDAWAMSHGMSPAWPGRIHPTDSEVAYVVRDAAREVS